MFFTFLILQSEIGCAFAFPAHRVFLLTKSQANDIRIRYELRVKSAWRACLTGLPNPRHPSYPKNTGCYPAILQLSEAPMTKPKRIYRASRELMDSCDAIIANLTPFRGISADPGTVFEVVNHQSHRIP
ncbi:nucleoside 2-deoxyribosyltransferase [Marinobacter orientalis]|uniref:nucleoside 2-deoxyribosyltransferase n=1 Tax=Marinobacter orientalis TaxID=1928859 RepID=UPI001D17D9DE|nr:nucleoside 2-deoxyribosyltransferase [Marinobacter orientalis]